MSADKALRLVTRYARLQTTICQRKRLYRRLFDGCEDPLHHGDEFAGSRCMASLKDAVSDNNKLGHYSSERCGFMELVENCEFCRTCLTGLHVLRHNRETLAKRRASLLAAMRRLGSKQ